MNTDHNKAIVDAQGVSDLDTFILRLAEALSGVPDKPPYFGWDLHSLHDCFFGGFIGTPPYDIDVVNAENMVIAFDQDALRREIEDSARIREMRAPRRGSDAPKYPPPETETLMDALFELALGAPVRLCVYASNGELIRSVDGRPFFPKYSKASTHQ